ncbi:catechol 1,2-dioxygenase 1 [Paraphaeosphaeria minitans]|uniref:Catechol 1,2-dioxygenase 1 n=1 Tax=Paraphaeosphaeria minitans TaxID=565426 RepID=A0A9P6GUD3_9PLEO|nr:catechol 1,2-dioxygenase 1 [Paraphaeosphaeria minitans]
MAQKPIVLDSAACIYNPHFTQAVINSTGPKATPRPTGDEQTTGLKLAYRFHSLLHNAESDRRSSTKEASRMSDDRRNESQLAHVRHPRPPVPSHRGRGPGALWVERPAAAGDGGYLPTIVSGVAGSGNGTYMHGTVITFRMGKPGEGVVLDVWHTVLNGLYDGPAGKILLVLDRHAHRPAHIQVIDIEADSELAVKESLIVDYKPIDGVSKAEFELLYGRYDFKMVTFGKKHSVAGATEVCSVV